MENFIGQIPVPPFGEKPQDQPTPEDRIRRLIKTPDVYIKDGGRDFILGFEFPPDADWRSVLVYKRALERNTGDDFFSGLPPLVRDGQELMLYVSKKDFVREDVERWRQTIIKDALSDDNLDGIEEEFAEVERRQTEDSAYDGRKKKFLTALLESFERKTPLPVELPVSLRSWSDKIEYRSLPDDLISQVLKDVTDNYPEELWRVEDELDELLYDALRLKTQRFEIARDLTEERIPDADRETLADGLKKDFLAYFRDLLKSGPGRNKIKYELKKMSPDYKPREKQ